MSFVITYLSLLRAGCHFKFWVADWFAQLNNKMGGDLKKIQVRGRERERAAYFWNG